jgi:hypothetical protein
MTVLLDMVGLGLIIPALPSLIAQPGKFDVAQESIVGGWMFFYLLRDPVSVWSSVGQLVGCLRQAPASAACRGGTGRGLHVARSVA